MIQHVYERCLEAQCFEKIVVATDDARIVAAVEGFGGDVFMTNPDHQSGTDRCFEVFNAMTHKFDSIINIQGDEPFISPDAINAVAELLTNKAPIATLGVKVKDIEQLFDQNKVKIVLNSSNEAMYFSRAAVPYQRDVEKENWLNNHDYYLHLGIYGFSSEMIEVIEKLEISKLEKMECLEQLRWLENGLSLKVGLVEEAPMGVDTEEDLAKLNQQLSTEEE